jgi:hypothetical protein
MKANVPEITKVIVATAFISGDTPDLIFEKISIGNVITPEPVVNEAFIKSSKDCVKAKSVPAKIPGASRGKVTFMNV